MCIGWTAGGSWSLHFTFAAKKRRWPFCCTVCLSKVIFHLGQPEVEYLLLWFWRHFTTHLKWLFSFKKTVAESKVLHHQERVWSMAHLLALDIWIFGVLLGWLFCRSFMPEPVSASVSLHLVWDVWKDKGWAGDVRAVTRCFARY